MGRTRRKRANKKSQDRPPALDHETNIVRLRKFMARNGFKDETDLRLRGFPATGRGIATSSTLRENDILITVPYRLMITYTTLHSPSFLDIFLPTAKLTIHDLLAVFLVLERHKKESRWSDYVNTLPPKHPWLPALLSEEHIELLPVDTRSAAKESRRLMEESWLRVGKSIKKEWTCGCCGESARCVIDSCSFAWGYVLVNTRAVYVEPGVVRGFGSCSGVLSDEPCMALCPLLDMFNHSYEANTRAELVESRGSFFYRLTTLTKYKKYEQVFISYGNHDNVKLLTEYGFFIPGNPYDAVVFEKQEVVKMLDLSLNHFQNKFISSHGFDKSLFISEGGPSFNLKAFLFAVAFYTNHEREIDLVSYIYSDNYPKYFQKKMKFICDSFLRLTLNYHDEVLKTLESLEANSMIIDFLRYRCHFIKKLYGSKQ